MVDWCEYQRLFAAYLDEFLSGFQLQTTGPHAEKSLGRRQELEELESVGALLRQLPSPHMPADLPFRIRHRISREKSRRQQPTWRWRWGNRVAPFALPAAAGLLSALVIFGALVRTFEIPVQANSQDVPLVLRTAPRLRSIGPLVDIGIECMVVQILIDENGRVADYQIVKGKQTPEQVRHLQNLLLFSVFDPATVFGKPTAQTVVLALRDVHLKGYTL